jgi:DNA-binding response OmpR family regulator
MGQLKVLIVDDSLLMRDIIIESIEEAFPDIEVSGANNGEEAQKLLSRRHFDLMLCDWEMPGLKGNDLLQWLRENSSQRAMPFIMITARGDVESILEVKQLGVTDYIVKPFTSETLCQKVKTVLAKSSWSDPRSPEVLNWYKSP